MSPLTCSLGKKRKANFSISEEDELCRKTQKTGNATGTVPFKIRYLDWFYGILFIEPELFILKTSTKPSVKYSRRKRCLCRCRICADVCMLQGTITHWVHGDTARKSAFSGSAKMALSPKTGQ